MDLEVTKFSELQPNFLNLSLLICQLFAGGNFRMAHILYHPEAYDDRLLSEMDSACPLHIPKMTTDISALGINPIGQNQRSDHILQLIFLPPNHLEKSMDRVRHFLTFYRVFIFTSNQKNTDRKWINNSRLIRDLNSSSLLLLHDSSNDTMMSFLLSRNLNNTLEPVDLFELRSEKDIFNSALGEKAINRIFGVCYLQMIYCHSLHKSPLHILMQKTNIFGKLYFNQLNMSYVDTLFVYCNESTPNVIHRIVRPLHRPTYSEFSMNVQPIQSKINKEHTTELHLTSASIYLTNNQRKIWPVNGYRQLGVRVIFVHGEDFKHHQQAYLDIFYFWKSEDFWIMSLIFIVSAIFLYYLRCLAGIRNVDFGVGFLEVFTVVFGGGNTRYQHRFEKWFFAIALVASFFSVSIYLADFTMESILREPEKVDTFEKLAKQNVTFYLNTALSEYKMQINAMLREKLNKSVHMEIISFEKYDKNILYKSMFYRTNSFAHVVGDESNELIRDSYISYGKEVDVINEILGVLNKDFYLASDLYVTQWMIEKFNQITTSMMENGWFHFIDVIDAFWIQLRIKTDSSTNRQLSEFQPITLRELYYLFIVTLLHLMGFALILICEIIWFYVVQRLRRLFLVDI